VKAFDLRFSPEADASLKSLYDYVETNANPKIARDYVNGIVDHCLGLRTFPMRGVARDDLRPGLRLTHYRKRVVIAYEVAAGMVSIINVFYGGREYSAHLRAEEGE